nr:DUF2752 domain-containing protein [uncultured Faecalimonas sp.]
MKKKRAGKVAAILGAGAGYLLWLRRTGIGIPCMFHKITGWLCPGCGITTLILCLSKADIRGAFQANPFLFVTGPFLLTGILAEWYCSEKEKKRPRWMSRIWNIYIVALCIFGVIRNW